MYGYTMGNTWGGNQAILSHDESSEGLSDESDAEATTTDALGKEENRQTPLVTLQMLDICQIESHLDLYEKISLVYLLYEEPKMCLGLMIQILQDPTLTVLSNWYLLREDATRAKTMLLEAVCIIQNYYVLRLQGYDKAELNQRFLPRNKHTSLHVSVIRKALYLMCEDFSSKQVEQFLSLVTSNFKRENLVFKQFNRSFLEMYLIYWESIKYFGKTDIHNLLKVFKVMELEEYEDCFKQLVTVRPYNDHEIMYQDLLKLDKSSPSSNYNSPGSSCSNAPDGHIKSIPTTSRYPINPNKPGVCLIINQTNFYKEHDEKYFHLMPKTYTRLEDREGTEKDRDELMATFEKFNFLIILKENLMHVEIFEEIDSAAKIAAGHSSLFICILSHGIEGRVYAVNSIPVQVSDIANKMCRNHGQPKVLVLQSCQGTICQEMEVESLDDFETDSPGSTAAPRAGDMMIFWATVPGFGAIRHKKKGSWFIQSFCEKMLEAPERYHFDEICVLVQQDVTNKRWKREGKEVGMISLKQSTFSKFLYLPLKGH